MIEERDLKLRKIEKSDSELILNWRNNPQIYKYLLSPNPVMEEEHESWFKLQLANNKVGFYIAYYGDIPCGAIRFDFNNDLSEAEVGIYIDPMFFGKGLGSSLLNLGEQKVKEKSKSIKLMARVLEENTASKKMFLKNDYKIKQITLEKEV